MQEDVRICQAGARAARVTFGRSGGSSLVATGDTCPPLKTGPQGFRPQTDVQFQTAKNARPAAAARSLVRVLLVGNRRKKRARKLVLVLLQQSRVGERNLGCRQSRLRDELERVVSARRADQWLAKRRGWRETPHELAGEVEERLFVAIFALRRHLDVVKVPEDVSAMRCEGESELLLVVEGHAAVVKRCA